MNHLMIDLETLGTKPTSAILSIGACYFEPDTGKIGDTFYQRIDFASAMKSRDVDAETIKWWFGQKKKARLEITQVADSHEVAMIFLHAFIINYRATDEVQVWSNGASFDVVLLEDCYNHQPPWKYWNIRDVRTIVELSKGLVDKKDIERTGIKHNALDDAIYQARFVSAMWQALRTR